LQKLEADGSEEPQSAIIDDLARRSDPPALFVRILAALRGLSPLFLALLQYPTPYSLPGAGPLPPAIFGIQGRARVGDSSV
jgi:hypothetical protein